MARDLNKAMLIGRLGSDPELRYTPQGSAVTKFSLATGESWKDKQTGETKDKTTWHRIVVWGRMAEVCSEYLSKGKQVFIEGRIDNRSWDDDSGQKKYITEIVAERVIFLGGAGGGQATSIAPEEDDLSTDGISDDDIPF